MYDKANILEVELLGMFYADDLSSGQGALFACLDCKTKILVPLLLGKWDIF
jgi:hypothetical protein